MNWLVEKLLGLDRGFLSREGDFSLAFNPQWPLQGSIGAAFWNVLILGLGVALVVYVYRREGRTRGVKISLAAVRVLLIALTLVLLNRPVLTLTQSRTEPSVLAVMIDDSLSMRIKDVGDAAGPESRLAAVTALLEANAGRLPSELAKTHQLKLYRFDSDAVAVEAGGVGKIAADGQKTQLTHSLRTVLRDGQGQRLAGVVVLSDGRDMPQLSIASALDEVKDFGVPVFPVPVGSDRPLRNVELQQVSAQDSVFVNDVANIKTTLRLKGPAGDPVTVRLKDKATSSVVTDAGGAPIETTVTPAAGVPTEVELQITPQKIGTLDLIVEAEPLAGEIDEDDNSRGVQLSVLDAKINVLYVEGFPRWDYRYLKNEMIRDKTVDISCLLTSADPTFRQEGDVPITRFPETIEELLAYDVVLFGDVDPTQFTDRQLQLVADFVSRRGGGFGMVAGPLYAPHAWKGSPIESILPVDISRTQAEEWGTTGATIAEGFRPAVTREGRESSLFRFFADRQQNDEFLISTWQPVFWFSRNVVAKPGVGEVMAEHPTETGPDGRRAPILVTGSFGGGRTMFLGIDDSWRWRYYTSESIFSTYWVQQLRFLARSRKLGQRKITLASQKPVYDLGDQVRLSLRVIDPQLLTQLPESLRVELIGENGELVGQQTFVRQEGGDSYLASFPADRVGKLTARLPSVAPGVAELTVPIDISVPRLELSTPEVDRATLSRLASETGGRVIEFADAEKQLLTIPSAQRLVPLLTNRPLWDAPIALAAFLLLITTEWVARKVFGMV